MNRPGATTNDTNRNCLSIRVIRGSWPLCRLAARRLFPMKRYSQQLAQIQFLEQPIDAEVHPIVVIALREAVEVLFH